MENQKTLKDDEEILIFADNREFNSSVVKELARKDCIVKPHQLEVGDYLISERVVVERKTASDFLESIFDKRMFDQAKNLAGQFENPVILIEGKGLYTKRNVHPNAVRGALSSLALDYKIPLMWSENEKDTAELIFWMAKREQIEEKRNVSIRGKRGGLTFEEKQEYLVSGLPSINSKISKRLLEHFKNPENVFTASEDELKNIKGIGKKMAKKLRKILTKDYGID
ncbi:MAG: ERCC4 domain-containing protein [Candidatus Aenigmatarchaeota archaeon]